MIISLDRLPLNSSGFIIFNKLPSKKNQNISNLGITNNSYIKCLFRSPFGDPTAYLVKNIIISLRSDDAKSIFVRVEE